MDDELAPDDRPERPELRPTHVDEATGIPIYAGFEGPDGEVVPIPLTPVDEFVQHPKNARDGDLGTIAESIKENGFYGAVQVQRSTGWIVVGNHRWEAAAALLGMAALPRLVIDVDDETALRMLVMDNRSSDLASYDERRQAALLVDLQRETDRGLAGTGWTPEELDQLLSDLESAPRPVVPPAEFPAVHPDTLTTEHRCPACGYEWSGKARAGADPEPDGG